ncbi:MAG: hypothetical protein RDU47_07490, partial [Spirochaetia bacterium]|nr:hypothetical protein [Spirochaetia bacterium]
MDEAHAGFALLENDFEGFSKKASSLHRRPGVFCLGLSISFSFADHTFTASDFVAQEVALCEPQMALQII